MPLKRRHKHLLNILDHGLLNIRLYSVHVVGALAEIETEDVHTALGYSSMWEFCRKRCKMSDDEAQTRLTIARLIQKFPELLALLEKGEITITNLKLLRNQLTEENLVQLTTLVGQKTKEQAQELLAERTPQPAEGSSLTKMRHQTEGGGLPKIEPRAADDYQLKLKIDRAFRDEIEEARALMERTNPSGDLGNVMRAAIQLLLKHLKKKQFAVTDNPAANPRPSNDPTFVTAATKRAVYERDGGQCTFVGEEGHRCEARGDLQFDHIDLRALGGLGTIENIRLRCRAHNLHGAKQVLGARFVEEKINAARATRAAKAEAKADAKEVRADAMNEAVAETDDAIAGAITADLAGTDLVTASPRAVAETNAAMKVEAVEGGADAAVEANAIEPANPVTVAVAHVEATSCDAKGMTVPSPPTRTRTERKLTPNARPTSRGRSEATNAARKGKSTTPNEPTAVKKARPLRAAAARETKHLSQTRSKPTKGATTKRAGGNR